MILTPSGIARGSRNQVVIGGVKCDSENIIKGTDVNRSDGDRIDDILNSLFGSP